MSSLLPSPATFYISPTIDTGTASAPKDVEADLEDNPTDSEEVGEDSESLFGGAFFSCHLLPAVCLIVPSIRRRHQHD